MRIIATLTAVLLALTACGTAPPSADTGNTGFNATDTMFAQMLATHQVMSDKLLHLAEQRATKPDLKTLVSAVRVTQADESKLVTGWLQNWKQPTEANVLGEGHGAHGGLPSNGEAELDSLTKAKAAEFDRTFINIFVGMQHQAVEYAKMELATGVNSEAKALAKRVEQSRSGQIEMMLKML